MQILRRLSLLPESRVRRSGSVLERYSTFATRIDHPCDLRGNREISRSTLGHVAKYPRSELAVLRGWPRASPRFVSVRAYVRETVEYTDTRARRQRVCQFSSLSLRERRPGSSDVRENSSWIGNDGAVGGVDPRREARGATSLWRLVPGKRLEYVEASKRKETLGGKNRDFI